MHSFNGNITLNKFSVLLSTLFNYELDQMMYNCYKCTITGVFRVLGCQLRAQLAGDHTHRGGARVLLTVHL